MTVQWQPAAKGKVSTEKTRTPDTWSLDTATLDFINANNSLPIFLLKILCLHNLNFCSIYTGDSVFLGYKLHIIILVFKPVMTELHILTF